MQHVIVVSDALDELPSVTEFGSAFLVAYIASFLAFCSSTYYSP